MAKKHILDCDESTWKDVKRFKLDYMPDGADLNDTLLVLIKRGMIRTVEAHMMVNEQQQPALPAPAESRIHIPLANAEHDDGPTGQVLITQGGTPESSVNNHEHSPQKDGKTPAKSRGWSQEKLEKIKREMKEKYGATIPT